MAKTPVTEAQAASTEEALAGAEAVVPQTSGLPHDQQASCPTHG